jgi:hypothetical protein
MGASYSMCLLLLAAGMSRPAAQPAKPAAAPRSPATITESPELLLKADQADALAAVLRAELLSDNESRRTSALAGLRRLRDPSLRPLMAMLSLTNRPALQLHGMLGLAELDARQTGGGLGRLDLLAVRQLPAGVWRSAVVQEAFGAGLLDDQQVLEVLAWADLEPDVYVALAARAVLGNQALDPARLEQLLDDPDAYVSAMSAVVLVQMDVAGTATITARRVLRSRTVELCDALDAPDQATVSDAAVPARANRAVLRRVLRQLSTTPLTAGALLLERLTPAGAAAPVRARTAGDQALLLRIALVRLQCAPGDTSAAEQVASLLRDAPATTRQEAGKGLLEVALDVAARSRAAVDPAPMQSLVDALTSQSTTDLRALGMATGAVLAGAGSSAEPLLALARSDDPSLRQLALRCAPLRAHDDARAIRLIALEAGERAGDARLLLAVGTELAPREPGEVARALERARLRAQPDSCAALLDALLRSGGESTPGALSALPLLDPGAWPGQDAPTLAMLTALRHGVATASDATTLERLRLTAADTSLDPVLRVQASWLALRALGEDRIVLARLLGALDSPAPPATADQGAGVTGR